MNLRILQEKIEKQSIQLLDLVRESCWNDISGDCSYLLTEVKYIQNHTFFDKKIERRKIFSPKTPENLDLIIQKLDGLLEDLYDIDLSIYKAEEEQTIIEIQYYLKSSLNKSNLEFIKDREVNIKTVLSVPPYAKDADAKFDVNWEFGGLRHQWKMFWWRFNNRK